MPDQNDTLSDQFDKQLSRPRQSAQIPQPPQAQTPKPTPLTVSPARERVSQPQVLQTDHAPLEPLDLSPLEETEKIVRPKKRLQLGKILLVVLGLVVFGAGGFAAFLFFSNTPEKQLQAFFAQLNEFQNVEVSGKIDATGTQKSYPMAPEAWISVLNLSTPISSLLKEYKATSPLNIAYSTDFRSTIDMTPVDRVDSSTKFNATVSSGGVNPDLEVSGQDTLIKGAHYISLENLRLQSFDAKKQSDAAAYLGETIKFDAKVAADYALDSYQIPQENKTDAERAFNGVKITPSDVHLFLNSLQTNSVLTLDASLQDRFLTVNVNGTESYHYTLNINKSALAQSVKEKTLSKFISGATDITGEIWIGANDSLPHRLSLVMNMPEQSGFKGTINVMLSFDKFNTASTIELPKNPVEATTVLDSVLPLLFPNISSTPASFVDTDKDGLSDTDEATYKTDPTLPDTDSDGFTDGDEVKNGYNPAGPGTLSQN